MNLSAFRSTEGSPARRRPRRVAAFGLLCLQLVLSVFIVMADGRPIAGESPGAEAVEQITGPHLCPFCTYLAAHQAQTPSPVAAPRTSIVLPEAVDLSNHAPPPITPVTSVHTSRAPPAR
jgi:hypothetical protein